MSPFRNDLEKKNKNKAEFTRQSKLREKSNIEARIQTLSSTAGKKEAKPEPFQEELCVSGL